MLPDPITVTINSVAKTLNRVKQGNMSATYMSQDELWTLDVSHQYSGKNNSRLRSLIRLTQKKIVTNPLDSTNDYDTLVDQRVIERPVFGFSQTELEQQVTGFNAWFTSTNIGKLFGKES
jgi:hypothetical protein